MYVEVFHDEYMNPVFVPQRMTEDDYFELLERTGERIEYWDGVVEGMAGGANEHYEVESNLFGELFVRLKGSGCAAMTTNHAIFIPARKAYVFADMSIVCGAKEMVTHRGIGCLTNPTVVVEVLSPSSSLKDATHKLLAYTTIKSVREYLLVSTDKYLVTMYSRASSDEVWATTLYSELDEEFELKSCGVRMRVRDVYGDRVQFPVIA
jgi:Uma2 family endonuclease